LRELEEETGIRSVTIIAESPVWYAYDLPEKLRPKAWGGRYRGQEQKWFAARFHGDEDEIVLQRPGHAPEFDAWRWAEIGELVDLIVPFKRQVYQQVVAEFAALARPQD
jgi:putative (di)nucleoside polyphosphate hydrolase